MGSVNLTTLAAHQTAAPVIRVRQGASFGSSLGPRGDYSMGVAVGTRIVMAAEMVPPGFRDLLTNWGSYIWSAPAP